MDDTVSASVISLITPSACARRRDSVPVVTGPALHNSIGMIVVDTFLLAKLISFFPPYHWLWRNARGITGRIGALQSAKTCGLTEANNANSLRYNMTTPSTVKLQTQLQLDEYMQSIENFGVQPQTIGNVKFREIERLPHYTGPSRSQEFKDNFTFWYFLLNIGWSTPGVLVIASAFSYWFAPRAQLVTAVIAVPLFAAIACVTLVTAPLTRLALGIYDIHSSGLQPYLRRYRSVVLRRERDRNETKMSKSDRLCLLWRYTRWWRSKRRREIEPQLLARSEPESDRTGGGTREGLIIYLFFLLAITTLLYASCYYVLDVISTTYPGFKPFTISTDKSTNWVSWFYFSVVTVATVGYGDISPSNHWTELVVASQILSGPFLVTWVLAVAFTERGK